MKIKSIFMFASTKYTKNSLKKILHSLIQKKHCDLILKYAFI